jgi:RNA polymerase sigma factor (sigma-70 family)
MSGSKRKTDMEQKQFDALLLWLDPNREQAGVKYEEVRHALIKIFAYRRFPDPEYLADLTISRVASKAESLRDHYEGNPATYFYAVAHQVHKMELRRPRDNELSSTQIPADASFLDAGEPEAQRCLEKCLEALPPQYRDLILAYYSEPKTAKIEARKRLAADLGVSLTNMRIQIHRMKQTLAGCVRKCLREGIDSTG